MDIQTTEGVRVEVSNSGSDDYVRYRWTISARLKCCCDKPFLAEATIPDRLIETDEKLVGQLSQALVKLVIESRTEHLKEQCDG
jgi:hypothetical protein